MYTVSKVEVKLSMCTWHKGIWESRVIAALILWEDWPALCPGCFTSREGDSGTPLKRKKFCVIPVFVIVEL